MKFLATMNIRPELPEELSRLRELAYNFYFSWNPDTQLLFHQIDPGLWRQVNYNPVQFLNEVQQSQLDRAAANPQYLALLKKVLVQFDQYMNEKNTWFRQNYPEHADRPIAYFSAEFGFHESLPIYAGGLGVLAGDHLKTASDLGLPLVGVSLFYHQGYFTQQIDAHGGQVALYPTFNPEELPLLPVLDESGDPVLVRVPLANRIVFCRLWKAQVGRVYALLLDTNIPQNSPEDRTITAQLYGGDQEMRISQEIVLGMGGSRALRELGIEPAVWHMNEGHSVFLALERIQHLVKSQGLGFYEALEAVAANTVFTTHTPVPAGNDAFPGHIKEKYFQSYWESVGIKRHEFMALGAETQPEGYEIFNLTILSLKLSRFRNAVSRLHGEVSRRLWHKVWPEAPAEEVPITHVTNGVHAKTWTVSHTRQLLDKFLEGDWRTRLNDPVFWRQVLDIPDEAIWQAKLAAKRKMLDHVRFRLEQQFLRNKVGTLHVRRLKDVLNPQVLTIGFARRFATYKRGTLIFRHPERLLSLLNNPERPVQILFAGKAHPRDEGGQELIRQIYEYSFKDGFRGKIFFIEGYDMHLARELVAGVDVWLNNPRRPQEASGTSGQKVGLNAGLNFSVLDGWWVEGYNGKNGWAFGDREDYQNLEELDEWDSEAIYDLLETEIIPLYYQRDEQGIPRGWTQMMKQSLASIMPQFNTNRMLHEYVDKLYLPAALNGQNFQKDHFKIAREYAAWRERVEMNWSSTRLEPAEAFHPDQPLVLSVKEEVSFQVKAFLGELKPEDVRVQVYLKQEPLPYRRQSHRVQIYDMQLEKQLEDGVFLYGVQFKPEESGTFQLTFRMFPCHPYQVHPLELGIVRWAGEDHQPE